jgi:hypothetical protein
MYDQDNRSQAHNFLNDHELRGQVHNYSIKSTNDPVFRGQAHNYSGKSTNFRSEYDSNNTINTNMSNIPR